MKMLSIDWGDLRPSSEMRHELEARLAQVEPGVGSKVYVSRRGSGFEARLRVPVQERSTEVRLHDDDVGMAIERLVSLLEIVARERRANDA